MENKRRTQNQMWVLFSLGKRKETKVGNTDTCMHYASPRFQKPEKSKHSIQSHIIAIQLSQANFMYMCVCSGITRMKMNTCLLRVGRWIRHVSFAAIYFHISLSLIDMDESQVLAACLYSMGFLLSSKTGQA